MSGIEKVASDDRRLDSGPQERSPPVNTMGIRENGPLALHAPMTLAGQPAGLRAALCRCGQSANKPWCDGAHVAAGFTATGEPPGKPSEPLGVRDGTVDIRPIRNGPLRIDGAVELVSGTGRTLDRATQLWLCRCGQSKNKPYCDGTHKGLGFQADGEVR
jgi:CDGSH-type Zn-finger protein